MRTVCAGLLVFAVGCSVDSPSDPSVDGTTMPGMPQAPRIEMKLTDAPGDFESVWVNITRVEVESADAGWQTLVEEPQRFDLLTLQNDVTAAMGSATLAPGMYGQLRLIVDEASVVVGGEESPLPIASGAQTGIKIPLDRAFEENMTYAVTLDFDAAKSVKTTGQGYLMTPVVHVKDFVATPMPESEPEPEGDDSPDDTIQ